MASNPATVNAVFAGVKDVWLLVGPVVGALLGSWLTARSQRSADRDRRIDEARNEHTQWARDETSKAYTRALTSVADMSRAASFVVWWFLVEFRGTAVAAETFLAAAEDFNATERELMMSHAALSLVSSESSKELKNFHDATKNAVNRLRSTTASRPTSEDEFTSARNGIMDHAARTSAVLAARAKEALGLPAEA